MNKIDIDPIDSWVKNGLYTLLFKDIESTNALASTLIEEKKVAGPTAIIAENQFQGRGQLQTKWHSNSRENLTFSLALPKINLDVSKQFKLNKCISISIYKMLEEIEVATSIKWPNDIYYGNNKLGGILVETQISGQKINTCIIGVGININQTQWPDSLPNPISIKQITGEEIEIKKVYDTWIPFIFHSISKLIVKPDHIINEQYKNYLYRLNEIQTFKAGNEVFKAAIQGVNSDGELELLTDLNKNRKYRFKQVQYIL